MLIDQSRSSGGLNLFYAGRTASDLGEEYYREQSELEGSTGLQRATHVGIAAFANHSIKNTTYQTTGYNKTLRQSFTPGLNFTSGVGVGYMLFGGDDPLEDTAQALGTGAAFHLAKQTRAIPKSKQYVGAVIDAFVNDTKFQSPFNSKHSSINNISERKYKVHENILKGKTKNSWGIGTPKPVLYDQAREIDNLKPVSQKGFFSRLFKGDNSKELTRANRLSKQTELINNVNKLYPVIKKGNSVTTSLTMGIGKAGTNIPVRTTEMKYMGALGTKPRTPKQILELARRMGNQAYRDRKGLGAVAESAAGWKKLIPSGRVAAGAAGVAALVGYGTYKVAESAFDTFQKGLNLAQNASRLDFGDGMAFNSGEAMTERQRALQAMANSNMNARSFMGNEAQFYF